MSRKLLLIINVAFLYVGWFTAVLGAAKGDPFAGPVVALLTLVIHLWMVRESLLSEFLAVFSVILIGSLGDSILPTLGFVSFSAGAPGFGAYPIWMVSLWVGYGSALSLSLAWLKQRIIIASIFGAVGGPLSVLAGVKLGAAHFAELVSSEITLVLLAFEWSLLVPLTVIVHRRVYAECEKSLRVTHSA